MGKRKYDADLNVLFGVKVLMGLGEIKNWKEAEEFIEIEQEREEELTESTMVGGNIAKPKEKKKKKRLIQKLKKY